MHFHFSRPSRSRSAHLGLRGLVGVPLWLTAYVLASACSRPDGDILYRPFWPADRLTDGVSGGAGLLDDAGAPTGPDPFRDASQGGTGGNGPGDIMIDSGTERDAAIPGDGDAGELGDAAVTPEDDAG